MFKLNDKESFLTTITKMNFWKDIGYKGIPRKVIHWILDYSKKVMDNWDSDLGGSTTLSPQWDTVKLVFMPMVDTSKATSMKETFKDCINLFTIPELDTSNVTNMEYCFQNCKSLTTIPELDTRKVGNMGLMFEGCNNLKRIEGLSVRSLSSMSNSLIYDNDSCRYILLKDIGMMNDGYKMLKMSGARVWGINSEDVPDARQSLIDSLLTYSFDRKAAGYPYYTIHLHSDVTAVLTSEEITAIQAKGYILD